jgi:hypothetical protein
MPGEAIDNDDKVAVEGLGLKGLCREVEAWHHEESQGEAISESTAQLHQGTQHFGDDNIMG